MENEGDILEICFVTAGGSDEIKANLYRDPKTGLFRPKYKGRPMVLWTAKKKAAQEAFSAAIDKIVNRILKGERGLEMPKVRGAAGDFGFGGVVRRQMSVVVFYGEFSSRSCDAGVFAWASDPFAATGEAMNI